MGQGSRAATGYTRTVSHPDNVHRLAQLYPERDRLRGDIAWYEKPAT